MARKCSALKKMERICLTLPSHPANMRQPWTQKPYPKAKNDGLIPKGASNSSRPIWILFIRVRIKEKMTIGAKVQIDAKNPAINLLPIL